MRHVRVTTTNEALDRETLRWAGGLYLAVMLCALYSAVALGA